MKITDIRDASCPIKSDIRNAFISFAEMTVSVVAVETDVVREGAPFGFAVPVRTRHDVNGGRGSANRAFAWSSVLRLSLASRR